MNHPPYAARRGRPRKYPLDQLEIGQSTVIPWREDEFGRRLKNQDPLRCAVQQDERRSGRQFLRVPLPSGLQVTRMK